MVWPHNCKSCLQQSHSTETNINVILYIFNFALSLRKTPFDCLTALTVIFTWSLHRQTTVVSKNSYPYVSGTSSIRHFRCLATKNKPKQWKPNKTQNHKKSGLNEIDPRTVNHVLWKSAKATIALIHQVYATVPLFFSRWMSLFCILWEKAIVVKQWMSQHLQYPKPAWRSTFPHGKDRFLV